MMLTLLADARSSRIQGVDSILQRSLTTATPPGSRGRRANASRPAARSAIGPAVASGGTRASCAAAGFCGAPMARLRMDGGQAWSRPPVLRREQVTNGHG